MLFQIPVHANATIIVLIVQSLYNLTIENTTLYFEVCKVNAGGCRGTTISPVSTTQQNKMTSGPMGLDQPILIMVVVLVILIVIALVVFGILCWRRKRKLLGFTKRDIGMSLLNSEPLFLTALAFKLI